MALLAALPSSPHELGLNCGLEVRTSRTEGSHQLVHVLVLDVHSFSIRAAAAAAAADAAASSKLATFTIVFIAFGFGGKCVAHSVLHASRRVIIHDPSSGNHCSCGVFSSVHVFVASFL